jgi:hypothetical protein
MSIPFYERGEFSFPASSSEIIDAVTLSFETNEITFTPIFLLIQQHRCLKYYSKNGKIDFSKEIIQSVITVQDKTAKLQF